MRYYFYLLALVVYTVVMLGVCLGRAESRDYCPVNDAMYYYTTNGRELCVREVTEAMPLCPAPGGSQIKGLVDTEITYLKAVNGRILTW